MSWMQSLRRGGYLLVVLGSGAIATAAAADEFPPCAPPANSEYLLLVKGDTVESRDRIQNLLPTTTEVSVCSYLDDVVVRAGGFTSLENANAWAQYLTEAENAQAFVARPAAPGEIASAEPIAAEPVEPMPELPSEPPAAEEVPVSNPVVPPEATVAYDPQLLGEGYAVLVDYANDPAVAKQLQQTLNQSVGLAVYEQQPFLLVIQSPDPRVAAQTLQALSNDRYGAFIVDSSEVVLISPGVATP